MSATTTLDIPVSMRKGEFLPEIAKILLLSFPLYIHLFSPETGDLLTKDHVSIDLFGKRILGKTRSQTHLRATPTSVQHGAAHCTWGLDLTSLLASTR